MHNNENTKINKFTSVTLKSSVKLSADEHDVLSGEKYNLQSEDVKKDKRVLLTKYFIAVIFVVTSIGMLTPDNVTSEAYVVIMLLFVLALTMYAGLYTLRNDAVESLVFSLLSVYFWVSYPLKLTVAVHNPEALWISGGLVDPKTISDEIMGSFITVLPSIVCLLLALFSFNRKRYVKTEYVITKINHNFFIIVLSLMMCIKIYSQVVLNIGMPGVQPSALPIPYLTGVVSLLSKYVLFAVVNLYFYYVIRLNDRKKLMVALVFVVINVALNLRVGYKGEMVIQGVLMIYYYFDAYRYLSTINRKLILMITISMVVLAIILYPLMNYYRHSLLTGANFTEAVKVAQEHDDHKSKSFSLSFIDRINGISEYYAATKLGEGREFGFGAIIDDSVRDLAKEKLYGANKDNVVTSFGATYFSVFYLVGGGLLVVVSGFVLGWVIRLSILFIRFKAFKSSFTFDAYLPLVCILWVRVLAGGGNILLPMKQLLLEVILFYLFERYGTVSSKISRKEEL